MKLVTRKHIYPISIRTSFIRFISVLQINAGLPLNIKFYLIELVIKFRSNEIEIVSVV